MGAAVRGADETGADLVVAGLEKKLTAIERGLDRLLAGGEAPAAMTAAEHTAAVRVSRGTLQVWPEHRLIYLPALPEAQEAPPGAVPRILLSCAALPRTNLSKMRRCSLAGMPTPRSRTAISTWPPLSASSTQTRSHPQVSFAGGPRTWAPDGQSILIRAYSGDGHVVVHTVNVESNAISTVLAQEPANTTLSTWSSDLKTYCGLRAGQVVAGRTETGEDKVIYKTTYPREVIATAISPDGRQVALGIRGRNGTYSVRLVPVSGGEPRDVVAGVSGAFWFGWGIAWSPDGRYIFYAARPPANDPDRHLYSLWRVATAGGEPVNTGISMTDLRDISVNPDGKRVAFSAGRLNGSENWVMENFLPSPSGKPIASAR